MFLTIIDSWLNIVAAAFEGEEKTKLSTSEIFQ